MDELITANKIPNAAELLNRRNITGNTLLNHYVFSKRHRLML